jgi:hypothetical protein
VFEEVCNCDGRGGCCQEGGIVALGFVWSRHDTIGKRQSFFFAIRLL